MEDRTFLTPFEQIFSGLMDILKHPGYYAAVAFLILCAFCFLVLTGGDD